MKKILLSFILNLSFSILELVGGILTNSVSILSDAIHDFGDALSIGLAYLFERKSKSKPNVSHTYGYARYSVLSAFITSGILIIGSIFVIKNAILRLIHPEPINYNGMIVLAIMGVIVNSIATFCTGDAKSLNEKAINLHMLEDALGWLIVLVGAIVMKFTNLSFIDPVLSIALAIFILYNAFKTLHAAIGTFLEKTPADIDITKVAYDLTQVNGVVSVHHIHIWSIDGIHHCCTLHVVSDDNSHNVKGAVRNVLLKCNVVHSTIELESPEECCIDTECDIHKNIGGDCGHHHHHHHHRGHHKCDKHHEHHAHHH